MVETPKGLALVSITEGYAVSTADLHKKNAGTRYCSNINSVSFSLFALVFHWVTENTASQWFQQKQWKELDSRQNRHKQTTMQNQEDGLTSHDNKHIQ